MIGEGVGDAKIGGQDGTGDGACVGIGDGVLVGAGVELGYGVIIGTGDSKPIC